VQTGPLDTELRKSFGFRKDSPHSGSNKRSATIQARQGIPVGADADRLNHPLARAELCKAAPWGARMVAAFEGLGSADLHIHRGWSKNIGPRCQHASRALPRVFEHLDIALLLASRADGVLVKSARGKHGRLSHGPSIAFGPAKPLYTAVLLNVRVASISRE